MTYRFGLFSLRCERAEPYACATYVRHASAYSLQVGAFKVFEFVIETVAVR